MSYKDFVYITDKGNKYLVSLDAAYDNTDSLGLAPPTGAEAD